MRKTHRTRNNKKQNFLRETATFLQISTTIALLLFLYLFFFFRHRGCTPKKFDSLCFLSHFTYIFCHHDYRDRSVFSYLIVIAVSLVNVMNVGEPEITKLDSRAQVIIKQDLDYT